MPARWCRRAPRFPLAPLFARLEREFAPLAAARGLRLAIVRDRRMGRQRSGAARAHRSPTWSRTRCAIPTRGGVVVGVRRRGAPGRHRRARYRHRHRRRRARADLRGVLPGSTPATRDAGQGHGPRARDHPPARGAARAIRSRSIRRPARGSRFAVVVPRAAARAASSPAATARAPLRARCAGALVAVVDDERAIVDAMRFWFAQWGAHVVRRRRPRGAVLAALGELGRYPDLIVADYRLADGALGTDAVARLRAELGQQIPAVLISGDASAEAFAAMRSTAPDVLLKPVLPDELHLLAERLLADSAGPSRDGAAANCLHRISASTDAKKSAPRRRRTRTDRVRRPCSDPGGGVDPACETVVAHALSGSVTTIMTLALSIRRRPEARPSVAAGRRMIGAAARRLRCHCVPRAARICARNASICAMRALIASRTTSFWSARKRVVEREPRRARLLAHAAVLLLHLVGQCRQRRQVGRALGKLGLRRRFELREIRSSSRRARPCSAPPRCPTAVAATC